MGYDWESALNNFLEFGDELVININKSEDNTQDLIVNWSVEVAQNKPDKSLRIVFSEFLYDDPDLDGKCKNSAVQACTHQFIILVDIDEVLLISQKPHWEKLALDYIQKDKCDCILIPSVNLWGDESHAKDINQKWYLCRQGLTRGVVNFARNKDGTHDIDKSDGTEPLIDKEGNLARSLAVVPPQISDYEKLLLIKNNDLPYVIHHGGVNFEQKIKNHLNFWLAHWKIEAGKEDVKVPITVEELQQSPSFEHGLKIKNE